MKYILHGASGRMGQEILTIGNEIKFQCVQKISFRQPEVPVPADLLIDFSVAEVFPKVLNLCVQNHLPLVSGTTGLSEDDFQSIRVAAKKIPILWASNTSLGVQFVRHLLRQVEKISDWDFHVEEVHHKRKLDKPSGTAKTLKQEIESTLSRPIEDCSAIRGGGVFGQHTIHMMAEEEVIKIEHTALSRKLFARGALKAAAFLKNQKPGLYDMMDVLLKHEK